MGNRKWGNTDANIFHSETPFPNLGHILLQVKILQLENDLAQARQRLGEMRKISYQEE